MLLKKSGFSKEFLDAIEKQLIEQKGKMENELSKFSKKNPHVAGDYDSSYPDLGDKEDENAAEVAEHLNNLPIEEGLEKSLRDLNKALDNLQKGTYGFCKYCKKPIEEKRLMARPTSSACIECKKAITQEL